MDAKTVIKESLATADMVAMAYLKDLSDRELMLRPHPQCNHINWQVGHLIASEHQMMQSVPHANMPELPAKFAETYGKQQAVCDDAGQFEGKASLLKIYQAQRTATLAALEATTPETLEQATGIDYAPTVASVFSMQSAHWLMHCGQWVIIRRETGQPVVI